MTDTVSQLLSLPVHGHNQWFQVGSRAENVSNPLFKARFFVLMPSGYEQLADFVVFYKITCLQDLSIVG